MRLFMPSKDLTFAFWIVSSFIVAHLAAVIGASDAIPNHFLISCLNAGSVNLPAMSLFNGDGASVIVGVGVNVGVGVGVLVGLSVGSVPKVLNLPSMLQYILPSTIA